LPESVRVVAGSDLKRMLQTIADTSGREAHEGDEHDVEHDEDFARPFAHAALFEALDFEGLSSALTMVGHMSQTLSGSLVQATALLIDIAGMNVSDYWPQCTSMLAGFATSADAKINLLALQLLCKIDVFAVPFSDITKTVQMLRQCLLFGLQHQDPLLAVKAACKVLDDLVSPDYGVMFAEISKQTLRVAFDQARQDPILGKVLLAEVVVVFSGENMSVFSNVLTDHLADIIALLQLPPDKTENQLCVRQVHDIFRNLALDMPQVLRKAGPQLQQTVLPAVLDRLASMPEGVLIALMESRAVVGREVPEGVPLLILQLMDTITVIAEALHIPVAKQNKTKKTKTKQRANKEYHQGQQESSEDKGNNKQQSPARRERKKDRTSKTID
jgi:hypothetical protein